MISVVIPTYRREQVLIDTIRALNNELVRDVELIIVDQTPEHTPDVERQLSAWHESQSIRWIRLSKPSIPIAMNTGLVCASHPLVLFLDDDIEFEPGFLNAHINAHRDAPAGFVAGRVVQPWQKIDEDTGSRVGTDLSDGFDFSSKVPATIDRVMAGNLSVVRDLAIAIGGFDENFSGASYRFEAEFADRALAAGVTIRFVPEASIDHLQANEGGTRGHGHHLTTISSAHSGGRYYYLLTANRVERRWTRLLTGPWRAVRTRHHLSNPKYIPVTLIAEYRGFFSAVAKRLGGRRILQANCLDAYGENAGVSVQPVYPHAGRASGLISVVMSVRNEAQALRVSSASVFAAQGCDIELILVLDDSDTKTREVAAEIVAAHGNVQCVDGAGDGLTAALIKGCELATGRYIARQDVGGRSRPDRFARQAVMLDTRSDLAFVGSWTEFTDPDFVSLFVSRGAQTPASHRDLLGVNGFAKGPTCHGSVMFRKEHYQSSGGYRAMFRYAQDWDLWLRLSAYGGYAEVEDLLYTHRIFPSGTSMRRREIQEKFAEYALNCAALRRAGGDTTQIVEAARALCEQARIDEQSGVASDREAVAGLYFLGSCFEGHNGRRARSYFRQVLKSQPLNLRAFVRYVRTWVPVS